MNVHLFADRLLFPRHNLVFWYEVLNRTTFADQCSKPVAGYHFTLGLNRKSVPNLASELHFAVSFFIAVNS